MGFGKEVVLKKHDLAHSGGVSTYSISSHFLKLPFSPRDTRSSSSLWGTPCSESAERLFSPYVATSCIGHLEVRVPRGVAQWARAQAFQGHGPALLLTG